jgi:hypothetical protein
MVMAVTKAETRRAMDDALHIGGYEPRLMSADERLDEVARLLAAGFVRMKRPNGEKRRVSREISVDLCARNRPHGGRTLGGRER